MIFRFTHFLYLLCFVEQNHAFSLRELYRKSAAEFFGCLFKCFACRGVFKNIGIAVFHVEFCGEFFVLR